MTRDQDPYVDFPEPEADEHHPAPRAPTTAKETTA
jgi:hypothetical protein